MKRICLIFTFIGFLPGVASALGLGNLTLDSGLNQPFEARIELLSPTGEELSSLRVQLADMEAFRRARIERPFILSQLRFDVEEPETGSDYIRIYSEQPIREPYLNFLVEASWSKGRLFREYTVLLDPPLYDPYSGQQAPAATTQPSTSTRAPVEAAPAPEQSVPYTGGFTGTEYGPVNTGETLWSIASRTRPDASVSIQQMMLALLRTNPEAFINNNINGLKRGQILRMPDKDEIQSLNQVEAIREARSQNSMWEDMRAAVAETTPVRPVTTEAKQPSTSVRAEEEEAELRLVTPGGEGEGQAGTAAEGKLDKDLALATEQLETATQENQELKNRLGESDSVINDLKRLVELKDDELAALQQQVAEAETGGEIVPPEETAEQEGTVKQTPETETPAMAQEQAEPEKQVTPPAVITEPAPSGIVDQVKQIVMDNLIIVAGVFAAVILIIVVLVFLARRRSSAEEEMLPEAEPHAGAIDEDEVETVFDARHGEAEAAAELEADISDSITETPEEEEAVEFPEEESEAATEFAAIEAAPAEAAPVEEEQPAEFEEEPLAEVNVFLAYEHFDQAEEFVRNAIEGAPENLDFHMKLLEVFYAAGNKADYEEEARVLHDLVNGQGSHWDMATAMWQEMSPNRALFAEPIEGEEEKAEEEAGGMLDLTAAEGQAPEQAKPEAGLDFDFGAEEEQAPSDEGVLDVSAPSPEEDILDVTAAISSGQSDQDLLDVTAAVGIESEPSEDAETPEQVEEEEILDVSAEEEPVLDITAGAEESALDITSSADLTKSDDDLLDVSKVSGEDLLDVTSHSEFEQEDAEEDLLDVTSSTSAGADSDELLEIGEEESDIKESEESNALEFDITGTEPGGTEEAAPEGDENILEFDTGAEEQAEDVLSLDMEQDLSTEAQDETKEPEGLEIDLNIDEQESGAEDLELSLDEGGEEPGAEIDLTMDEEGVPEISLDDTSDVPDLEIESTEGDTEFDLELETGDESMEEEGLDMEGTVEIPKLDLVANEEGEEDDDEEHTVFVPRSSETKEQSQEDEVATKLDLAKAYVELGDKDSAKGILEEIIADGNDQQRTQAQELLKQI